MAATSMWDIQEIPESRRNRLYLYVKRLLQNEFDISDRFLLSTTDRMVKDILELLKLKVVKEV